MPHGNGPHGTSKPGAPQHATKVEPCRGSHAHNREGTPLNITTLPLGEHVAHLDPIHGTGMLVMPDWSKDVRLGFESLLEADWSAALARLNSHGFTVLTEADHSLVSEGVDHLGRVVVSLIASEPQHGEPDLEALARSWRAVSESAQLACA